jgi:sugar phosphate permease
MANRQSRWKFRYTVVGILFVTWIVSYMDRMVMSAAIPYIAKEWNLSPSAMGVILSAFFAGYALCQVPGGILADKFGPRRLATIGLVWWSTFTAITGFATSLANMVWIRVAFGIGEGLYPGGALKLISIWFPLKERATANAFMNSSNALGPALAPLFVAVIMAAWGWRTVFYTLFVPGLIMALFIWVYVRDKPSESRHVTEAELAEITSKEPQLGSLAKKAGFLEVMKVPIIWQCFLIWMLFDVMFWGFVSWLPSYLVRQRGFELVKMGITASLPFFAGTIGLNLGGWISDKFFVGKRKQWIIMANLISALFLYLTYTVESANTAVVFQTFAGLFICMAFAGIWALPMNVIPSSIMGTAGGFINLGGQIAGFCSPMIMGFLIQAAGGKFDTAFMFLMGGAIASSMVALTVNEGRKTTFTAPS